MKKQKNKKQKPPRITIFNLQDQIRQLGFILPISRLLLIQGVALFGFFLFGLVMKLPLIWTIPLLLQALYFIPIIIYNQHRNRYELKRFSDVNVYIEQTLYAFKNSKKILNALKDVRILFPNGEMKDLIDQACYTISTPNAVRSNENAEVKALQIIENHYNNTYIRSLHRFLLKVERIGGECEQPIALLLNNRELWNERILKLQEQRQLKKGQILGSCIASMLICLTLLYILPADVNIANLIPVRIANVAMVFILGKIYLKSIRKLSSDLLSQQSEKDAEKLKTDYFKFINYNATKEFKKSIIFTVIPLGLAILNFFLFKLNILYFVSAILFIITLCQHMIGHTLLERRLKHEIAIAFPQWLLELTLLLQSDNVQVSIFKTVKQALPIMQPELEKLKKDLDDHPNSADPYFAFFSDFHLPEITTSMQMLYALSSGSGGNSKEQISNIVKRNNSILDRAETKANNDSLAGLYALFLAPMLVGSVVLMLDMSLFLMNYITKLTM